jgi:cation transport regulator
MLVGEISGRIGAPADVRDGAGRAILRNAKSGSRTRKGIAMPYNTIADLPKGQTDQYSKHQKDAFLKAFNNAYDEYHGDEGRAFAVAHTAAKRAGEKAAPG